MKMPKPSTDFTVAVVDDDASIRESIAGLMRSHGHVVEAFASAEQFLGTSDIGRFDCLVSDIQMPGLSGLDLVDLLGDHGITLPVVLMTACVDQRAEALARGVKVVLLKPFDCGVLGEAMRAAMALPAAD